MYVWLWRTLPGNVAAKVAGACAIFAGVVLVLFFVVFPYAEPRLPWNNVTIDGPATPSTNDDSNIAPASSTPTPVTPTSTSIVHPTASPSA